MIGLMMGRYTSPSRVIAVLRVSECQVTRRTLPEPAKSSEAAVAVSDTKLQGSVDRKAASTVCMCVCVCRQTFTSDSFEFCIVNANPLLNHAL